MSIRFWYKSNKTILFFVLQIFLMSIFFNPFSKIPFEVPKVKLLLLTTDIGAIISLIYIKSINKNINKRIIFFAVIYLGAVFLASLLGNNFNKSFWGNYWRLDGIFTLIHLIGLFFIYCLFWKDKYNKIFAYTITLSTSLVSLYAIFQRLISFYPPYATFGNPNFLAGFLIVAVPFGFLLALSEKKTPTLWILNIILNTAAIILTKSYSAIIMLPIVIIFCIVVLAKDDSKLLKRNDKKVKTQILFALFTFLLFVFGFLVYSFVKGYLNERLKYRGYLPEGRERIYMNAIIAIYRKPIFGWGYANFDYAFEEISWPMKWMHDVYVDKAHGELLEILSTTGIVGFIPYLVFVALVISSLVALSKNKNGDALFYKTATISVFCYLIHSQTNVVSISEIYIFWVITGITVSKGRIILSKKGRKKQELE